MAQRTPVQVGPADHAWRRLEVGGGRVEGEPPSRLILPPVAAGYGNAQFDDGPDHRSGTFMRRPALRMRLRARFSHPSGELLGTAGFGFWNAPFGPATRGLSLPQAAWFFFASPPSDLPLAEEVPGRGWFASTIDAGRRGALPLIPLAPAVVVLNQFAAARRRIWPRVRQRLGMSFAPLPVDLREWHRYELDWTTAGCSFRVDGQIAHMTAHSPRGPLSFVCWIDNQSLVLTPRGRFSWKTLPTAVTQWLEIEDLQLDPLPEALP